VAARASAVISFPAAIFQIEVVKKAAYRFLDRFVTEFRIEGTDIVCVLTFPDPRTSDYIESAINDFRAEVLDQDLRRLVAEETSGIRTTILALAFSPSHLSDRE
jgi:His-Xaa-Ser system protein HxsD